MLENNRFKDMPWATSAQNLKVLIIGLGGIGSWLSLYLARLGCKISLADGDYIDKINFSGQLYQKDSIGVKKIEGINKITNLFVFDNNPIINHDTMINEYNIHLFNFSNYDVIIECLDNMTTRKLIFNYCNKLQQLNNAPLLIDGRLLADQFSIYTLRNSVDYDKYKSELFNDNDIPQESCTTKQTSHVAAMIGSVITQIITNYIVNKDVEHHVLQIPFQIHYYGPTFEFNIKNND